MTSEPQIQWPIGLNAAEGDAVGVLDALLGLARPDATRAVTLSPVRPELLAAGASRIRVAALRYLVEDGGFRERQVLRNGRRALGRAWSPELGGGLRLTYTEATSTLWLEAARHLPSLGVRKAPAASPNEGERKHRRLVRDMVTTAHTAAGDWLFYAMVQRNLGGFSLPAEDHTQLTRKLRQGSPLAALMALDSDLTGPELRGRLGRLCELPTARVIECIEDRLADAWLGAINQAWTRYDTPASRTTRWNTIERVLVAWVEALDEAHRMDLARPVMKLFGLLLRDTFAKGGEAARTSLSTFGWVRNMRERDELIASVASVIAVATDLLRRRDVLAMERYGDERYDEAQIYLRDVSELLAPSRRGIDGLARALSDTVG